MFFNIVRYNLKKMKKITRWLNESAYIAPLSPACKMCAQGSKMVVLVTGLCSTNCFYCPLSFKKSGKDCIFADEWKLDSENDTQKLISEAEFINASGAGITGGDPLLVWKRVKHYIELFKETFGKNFHIHLYTSGLKNANHIADLISAGLDEIRFHPMPPFWENMDRNPLKNAIKKSLDTDADVAIEIPAIPIMETQMFSLVRWANNVGIRWINLNELEFSERNCNALSSKGYFVKDDISAAVKGSQKSALQVLDMALNEEFDIGVHYCSVSFKDGVQLKNRIKRRAGSIAKDHEVISKEGTLIKGIILKPGISLHKILVALKKDYGIPDRFLFLDNKKNRIEIGLWILEEIVADLKKQGYDCYMVEEYPTADRLEVERIPLPL